MMTQKYFFFKLSGKNRYPKLQLFFQYIFNTGTEGLTNHKKNIFVCVIEPEANFNRV